MKKILLVVAMLPLLASGAYAGQYSSGWNLLGNSSAALSVASAFGDPSKVATVWAWNPNSANWAFYSPGDTDGGKDYAASKGFGLLATISANQGFWVNAKANFSYPPAPAVDLSPLNGSGSSLMSYAASGAGCAALGFNTGSYSDYLNYSVDTNGAQATISIFGGGGYFTFALDYQSGNNTSGYTFSGTFKEVVTGLTGTATALSVKKKPYYDLEGFFSGTLGNNCTISCSFD